MEATGGTAEESTPGSARGVKLPLTMSERLMADLKEENHPTEGMCKRVMGMAHLGVIPLPTWKDKYEQSQINHNPIIKKNAQNKAIVANPRDHRPVNLLIFGGSNWIDKEPNPYEFSDQCLMLTIEAGNSSTY